MFLFYLVLINLKKGWKYTGGGGNFQNFNELRGANELKWTEKNRKFGN